MKKTTINLEKKEANDITIETMEYIWDPLKNYWLPDELEVKEQDKLYIRKVDNHLEIGKFKEIDEILKTKDEIHEGIVRLNLYCDSNTSDKTSGYYLDRKYKHLAEKYNLKHGDRVKYKLIDGIPEIIKKI